MRNSNTTLTPMMQQYMAVKQEYPDMLLFYRMGDFFELFFDDAITASKVLDITLTKRGKVEGEEIPMCGVPVHSHESYLHKLISNNFKVVICDQVETPEEAKKRGGYKAVVKREATRIITPATLSEENLLDSGSSNYLCAIHEVKDQIGIGWLDMSTGEFFFTDVEKEKLFSEIERINPSEIILADQILDNKSYREILTFYKKNLTNFANSFFDASKGKEKLKRFYDVKSLEGFADFDEVALSICGALVEYLEITQKDVLPKLLPPQYFAQDIYMSIDTATRRSLEIVRTQKGEVKGSLFSVLNKTVTAAGSRLLFRNISAPLLDLDEINKRADDVEFLFKEQNLREDLRLELKKVPDLERVISRIALKRCSPLDLLSVRYAIEQVLVISDIFYHKYKNNASENLKYVLKCLGVHDELLLVLREALNEELSVKMPNGGFIKDGYDAKLDEYRYMQKEGHGLRQELLQKYKDQTGIQNLKIKENNVIGTYIEVSNQYFDKMPEDFIHRQTLANVVRFTTPELKELEHKIINAKGYGLALENKIFGEVIEKVIAKADDLLLAAHNFAYLDFTANLAEIAHKNNYVRPELDLSKELLIEKGRHPVVERNLFDENKAQEFIGNDIEFSNIEDIWLITGPNMAGKSTFLRQNALIIIMAQMGGFVPAAKAKIGMVDKIFSRVGAADDLARGQSTFMVEMVETANILNNATEKSFVILDEIGRGTATFDGLSIAWAVLEYLHDNSKCRTLFATHYHEMTSLKNKLSRLACHTMQIKEWQGKVIFMHKVIKGMAKKSYGIHVGKIAGLPNQVIVRANEILALLGKQKLQLDKHYQDIDELPIFANIDAGKENELENIEEVSPYTDVINMVKECDLDNLSPRQSLELLYEIKEKLNEI